MGPCAPTARRPGAALAWSCATALTSLVLLVPSASASVVPVPGERARGVRAPHCTLPGARTIAANRHVRVFEAREEVFGCRRTANRAYEIGHGGSECQNNDLIDTAVVAGNFAALNVRTCGLHGSQSSVALVNLLDGRVRYFGRARPRYRDRPALAAPRRLDAALAARRRGPVGGDVSG